MACSNKICPGCNHVRARVNGSGCGGCANSHGCCKHPAPDRPPHHGCCPDSGYGVLGCVAGPWSRFGPKPDDPDFPFYTGPCGPCPHDDCPCGHHPAPPPPGNNCCAADFVAASPLQLCSGGCVPFSCASDSTRDFEATPEGIRFRRGGCYMAVCTLHVPANETLSSRFTLALNGEQLQETMADISATACGSSASHSMHAVVHAREGSLLQLLTLSPISLHPASACNLFSLTLVRLA